MHPHLTVSEYRKREDERGNWHPESHFVEYAKARKEYKKALKAGTLKEECKSCILNTD